MRSGQLEPKPEMSKLKAPDVLVRRLRQTPWRDIGLDHAERPLNRAYIHLLDTGIVEARFLMSEGRIPDPAFAVLLRPHDGHVAIGPPCGRRAFEPATRTLRRRGRIC